MDDKKMDAERAAFEDWADSQWPGAKREQLKCDAYGEYLNSIYRDLWRGWQARASLPVGVPEGWHCGVEAVAKMLEKKADDYATEQGHNDMGGLSFGSGPYAQIKADFHNSLIELAEEVRAMLAAAPAAPTVKAERAPVAWRVSISGMWAYFSTKAEAQAEYDQCHAGDEDYAEYSPEPLYAAPALPVAGVEEVEVVGYVNVRNGVRGDWLHKSETAARAHDRTAIAGKPGGAEPEPLMTVAQHNRIVAALSAQQAGAVSVPRELLWRAVHTLAVGMFDGDKECATKLRALLPSSERGGE